jgi:peptidoglycan/xylan/chitin deacetylase (PgdA/CDA1 family)
MRDSGLIQFGAHTHTHPILGRCSAEVARDEIFTSRSRIMAELQQLPSLFAYPNGQDNDYTATTQDYLRCIADARRAG